MSEKVYDRQEKNIRLAEWLGWHRYTVSHDEQQAQRSDPCDICNTLRHHHTTPPDCYTLASMSFALLAKMPEPNLWVESSKGEERIWACIPDLMQEQPDTNPNYICVMDHDLKVAIADCAFEYLMKVVATKPK